MQASLNNFTSLLASIEMWGLSAAGFLGYASSADREPTYTITAGQLAMLEPRAPVLLNAMLTESQLVARFHDDKLVNTYYLREALRLQESVRIIKDSEGSMICVDIIHRAVHSPRSKLVYVIGHLYEMRDTGHKHMGSNILYPFKLATTVSVAAEELDGIFPGWVGRYEAAESLGYSIEDANDYIFTKVGDGCTLPLPPICFD